MDTTKPPLICPTCQEPIAATEPMDWRTRTDPETGALLESVLYHRGCAPAEEE